MTSEELYQKYEHLLGKDWSKYQHKIGDKVIILDFENEKAYYGLITALHSYGIRCEYIIDNNLYHSSLGFNLKNYNHKYSDFVPLKYALEEKINRLLKI